MTLIRALQKIRELGLPAFRTADVALHLGVSASNASQILRRLHQHDHVVPLKRGLWTWPNTHLMTLTNHLTAPFPSYISLHTALYYHGMISQIPDIIYCVSVARTRRYSTPLGTASIHHLPPDLFFGCKLDSSETWAMATPEKTLLDFLYLGSGKTRLFAAWPEIELADSFSHRRFKTMVAKIPDPKRRSYVQRRADELFGAA